MEGLLQNTWPVLPRTAKAIRTRASLRNQRSQEEPERKVLSWKRSWNRKRMLDKNYGNLTKHKYRLTVYQYLFITYNTQTIVM